MDKINKAFIDWFENKKVLKEIIMSRDNYFDVDIAEIYDPPSAEDHYVDYKVVTYRYKRIINKGTIPVRHDTEWTKLTTSMNISISDIREHKINNVLR